MPNLTSETLAGLDMAPEQAALIKRLTDAKALSPTGMPLPQDKFLQAFGIPTSMRGPPEPALPPDKIAALRRAALQRIPGAPKRLPGLAESIKQRQAEITGKPPGIWDMIKAKAGPAVGRGMAQAGTVLGEGVGFLPGTDQIRQVPEALTAVTLGEPSDIVAEMRMSPEEIARNKAIEAAGIRMASAPEEVAQRAAAQGQAFVQKGLEAAPADQVDYLEELKKQVDEAPLPEKPAARPKAKVVEESPTKEAPTIGQSVRDHIKQKEKADQTSLENMREKLMSRSDLGGTFRRAGENIVRANYGLAPKEEPEPDIYTEAEQEFLEKQLGAEPGSLSGVRPSMLDRSMPLIAQRMKQSQDAVNQMIDARLKVDKAQLQAAKDERTQQIAEANTYNDLRKQFVYENKETLESMRNVNQIFDLIKNSEPGQLEGLEGNLIAYKLAKIADSSGRITDQDLEMFLGIPGLAGIADRLSRFLRSRPGKGWDFQMRSLVEFQKEFNDYTMGTAVDGYVKQAKSSFGDLIDETRLRNSLSSGAGWEPQPTVFEVNPDQLTEEQKQAILQAGGTIE